MSNGVICKKYYTEQELKQKGFSLLNETDDYIRYEKIFFHKGDNCEIYYIWYKKREFAKITVIKQIPFPCAQAFPFDSETEDIAIAAGLEKLCYYEPEI